MILCTVHNTLLIFYRNAMSKGIRVVSSEEEYQRLNREFPQANAAFFNISDQQIKNAINDAKYSQLTMMLNPGYYRIWKKNKNIANSLLD